MPESTVPRPSHAQQGVAGNLWSWCSRMTLCLSAVRRVGLLAVRRVRSEPSGTFPQRLLRTPLRNLDDETACYYLSDGVRDERKVFLEFAGLLGKTSNTPRDGDARGQANWEWRTGQRRVMFLRSEDSLNVERAQTVGEGFTVVLRSIVAQTTMTGKVVAEPNQQAAPEAKAMSVIAKTPSRLARKICWKMARVPQRSLIRASAALVIPKICPVMRSDKNQGAAVHMCSDLPDSLPGIEASLWSALQIAGRTSRPAIKCRRLFREAAQILRFSPVFRLGVEKPRSF